MDGCERDRCADRNAQPRERARVREQHSDQRVHAAAHHSSDRHRPRSMAPDVRWLVGSRHANRDLQVMHREHDSCMRRILMIDLSWITPELAIGACFLECEIESLAYEY